MTALETANAVLNFAVPGVYFVVSFSWWAANRLEGTDKPSALEREIAQNVVLRSEIGALKRQLDKKREEDAAPMPRPVGGPDWTCRPPQPAPYVGGVEPLFPGGPNVGGYVQTTTSNDWQTTALGRAIAATGKIPDDWPFDDGEATA